MARSRSLAELAGMARASDVALRSTDTSMESRGTGAGIVGIPRGSETGKKVKQKVSDSITKAAKDAFGMGDPTRTDVSSHTGAMSDATRAKATQVPEVMGSGVPVGGPTAVDMSAAATIPKAAAAAGTAAKGAATAAAAAPAAAAGAGAAGAAGGAAGLIEAIGPLAAIFCWVAAEYYPRGTFNWFCCRNWVLSHPRLTKVYAKHGETFALFLRTHPVAHWLFTPVVRYARYRGAKP